MFFRKQPRRKAISTPAESGSDGGTPIPSATVVDFLAEFLQIYGQHAFDLDDVTAADTARACETWARRLRTSEPPRGSRGRSPDSPLDDEQGDQGSERDLPELRRFYQNHRSREKTYVTRVLNELRAAIWTFIRGLRYTVSADQSSGRQVAHRLRQLESAVRSDDADSIKREAQETIGLFEELAQERNQRQKAELDGLAARLDTLRGELDPVCDPASVDALCQLYNRRTFDEQIPRVLDYCTLFDKPAYLLILDLDHFKRVNDTYGHPCGNEVLRRVGEALSLCFRRRSDFVARSGGEEFAVVLRECPLSEATMLAERALDTLRNLEIRFKEEAVRITASLGVARLRCGEDPGQWIERADSALYRAKQRGRDRVAIYPGDED